ncbi:MAG TPA: hypothetical protein PLU65_12600, partial [Dokdonella sp.]|nr:hypothetical protein [Dokdonella sp.]
MELIDRTLCVTEEEQTLAHFAAQEIIPICRNGNGGENADHGNHDQQFNEGEARAGFVRATGGPALPPRLPSGDAQGMGKIHMRFTSGSHAKFVAHHQRHASIACRADNRSIRAILEVANSRHARHR